MVIQPQGCDLSAEQFDEVVAIYAQAADSYIATAQIETSRASIEIRGPKDELKVFLDEMAARESGCCSHIAFEIIERSYGFQVMLQMPDQSRADVQQAVTTFFPAASIVS